MFHVYPRVSGESGTLLPSATVVAERECFHKRVLRILSTGGGEHVWWGVGESCVAGETTTAANGRHPTGMHSC